MSSEEIHYLNSEKERLRRLLTSENLSFDKKYSDFMFSFDEIKNAKEVNWLIKGLIPSPSIGVFIGESGSGKSTLILELCKQLLTNNKVYLYFIDGDMSVEQLKSRDVHKLMEIYQSRFNYYGKDFENFQEKSQNLLRDVIALQKMYRDRIYIVVQDSLSLTVKKKFGFIDTERLYENDKELRRTGGSSILIHHTNKSGIFADSQHIINFCDYSYVVKRQDFNSCVLLEKHKASRFDIQNFAFRVENRKIIEKVDYEMANIDNNVIIFIKFVREALEDNELNQSELIKYLEEIRFFSNVKIGKSKAMKMLKKHAKVGGWSYEKRVEQKNALVFFLVDDKKLKNLKN